MHSAECHPVHTAKFAASFFVFFCSFFVFLLLFFLFCFCFYKDLKALQGSNMLLYLAIVITMMHGVMCWMQLSYSVSCAQVSCEKLPVNVIIADEQCSCSVMKYVIVIILYL